MFSREKITNFFTKQGLKVEYADGFEDSLAHLFSSNPRYAIPRWLKDKWFDIRMAWQRATRGWEDDAWWNFHHIHSARTRDQLRELAKHHCGCPGNLCHKPGYHFNKNDDHGTKDANAHGEKCEWTEILNEMADGFQAMIDLDELPWGEQSHAADEKGRAYTLHLKIDRGWDLFREYYRNLWD